MMGKEETKVQGGVAEKSLTGLPTIFPSIWDNHEVYAIVLRKLKSLFQFHLHVQQVDVWT